MFFVLDFVPKLLPVFPFIFVYISMISEFPNSFKTLVKMQVNSRFIKYPS